jgi:phosphate transport system permease protein
MKNPRIKKLEERFFFSLMKLATGTILFGLLFIFLTILFKGIPQLSWEMISTPPEGGFYMGGGGGILNAISGSLYLGLGSTFLGLLLAIPIVIWLNIYAGPYSKLAIVVRTSLDMLFGVPSIVLGAFGFILMLTLGLKASLLAGIIILTLLILPILVRAMDEAIRTIPKELHEATLSLGATRWEMATKVILRKVFPGIITASLLGFGRAIGDAASIMFTAGFTDRVPTSLSDSAASLPLAIFFQLGSPFASVRDRAYAAALVLTLIILLISFLSRIISWKFQKYSR